MAGVLPLLMATLMYFRFRADEITVAESKCFATVKKTSPAIDIIEFQTNGIALAGSSLGENFLLAQVKTFRSVAQFGR